MSVIFLVAMLIIIVIACCFFYTKFTGKQPTSIGQQPTLNGHQPSSAAVSDEPRGDQQGKKHLHQD